MVFATVRVPRLAAAENKLVDEAVVEKKLVEVAEVVVELPLTLRFPVNVDEALVKIMLEVVAETPAAG
jgi:hypothetical protein